MFLQSKSFRGFLRMNVGIAIGSLLPIITVHAAAGAEASSAAANSQYRAAAPVAQTTQPIDADEPTAANVDAKPKMQKKTGFKDQPVVKEFTWDGSYVGVYGGGAWGNSRLNSNVGVLTPSSYFTTNPNIRSVNETSTGTVQPKSGVFGIQVGTNVQSDRLVYGVVFDYGSFNLNASKNANNVVYPSSAPATYSLTTYMSTSWLASARARLGFAPSIKWPLMYVTGGIAFTNLHVYNAFKDKTASAGVGGGTNTKTKPGWVVGAGLEYPIRMNWTIDGEYQFVNFGSNKANSFITCAAGCSNRSPYSTAANLSASMVRIGLNYKFS